MVPSIVSDTSYYVNAQWRTPLNPIDFGDVWQYGNPIEFSASEITFGVYRFFSWILSNRREGVRGYKNKSAQFNY